MSTAARRSLAALLVVTALATACSTRVSAPGTTGATGAAVATDAQQDVEVFASLRGRDADALREVLAAFTAETGIPTRYVGTAGFAHRLPERLREGDPPDVALLPQPALLAELARAGHLVALDELTGLEDTLHPGAETVGLVDGVRYGVWFRVSLKSLVWYPPAAFEAAGYPLPETWDELLALSRTIAADGTPPWCLGMEDFGSTGWVGTDWIEDLILRLHGPEVYDAWVAREVPFTDPRIAEAFEAFGAVALAPGQVAGGSRAALTAPTLRALWPMLDDPPGCLLSRQASFQVTDLPPGTRLGPEGDLDVFVLPGVDADAPPLIAGGDLVAALTDRPETRALVAYLASPEAGEVWAARGGFLSPHAAFASDAYADPFDRRLAELLASAPLVRFDGSDQLPTAIGTGSFWTGMVAYVGGVPLSEVLEVIEAGGSDGPGG